MKDYNSPLELLKKFLSSVEGQAKMDEYAQKAKAKDLEREVKHKSLKKLTNAQFKELIMVQAGLHDEAYADSCYSKGYEPYPQEELQLILDVMMEYGKAYEPKEWEMFASEYVKYKGLIAVLYQGQGCFYRIYDNEEILIQT